ncbi:MAG: biopolymer transporter ExbD [Bacteroidota bacterium]
MIKFVIKGVGLWLLLGPMISLAQVDSIRLPKGDETIKLRNTTPLFSIYVDADNNVYFEKEPIVMHKIVKKLAYTRYKLPEHLKPHATIFLYIDEQTAYTTVDEIKTQLASAYFDRIYLKTNSIADKDILKGFSVRRHPSFFTFHFLHKVPTDKEIERSKRINDSLRKVGYSDLEVIPPPPLPPGGWYEYNIHKIYSDNQDAIDEALDSQSYTCAVLTNEGFRTDSGLISLDDTEGLEALFRPGTIIFVRFDKALTYGNYFKASQHYRHMDVKNRGYFVELSHEIVDIHKRSQITLCD